MNRRIRTQSIVDAEAFGSFDGRIWLNAAHQGPLPLAAAAAAHQAVAEKVSPGRIADEAFFAFPRELKRELGDLLGVPGFEVVLGNSTTYGLHLLTHGLSWQVGDEVLLVDGDFPATVIPWLALRRRGVRVRMLKPSRRPLTAAELERQLGPATRVFCSSWVFSFTGEAIDLQAIGALCRERGVRFVLNASQAIGARPIDLATAPVDALVSCGFKWLCGPYGTGFCWIEPGLLERLEYEQPYWLAQMHGGDLSREGAYELHADLGAARYDVFCTANFLNFAPWRASIKLLLDIGVEAIAAHDQALVQRLIDGLVDTDWELVSPAREPERSTLVLIRHPTPERTAAAAAALAAAGIDIAERAGSLRFSPHLYNTTSDIDRVLAVIDAHAGA